MLKKMLLILLGVIIGLSSGFVYMIVFENGFNGEENPVFNKEFYISKVEEAYFPGHNYKEVNVGEIVKFVENNQADIQGGWRVLETPKQLGNGRGKFVDLFFENQELAIGLRYWVNEDGTYVEYVDGTINQEVEDPDVLNTAIKEMVDLIYDEVLEHKEINKPSLLSN